MPPSTGEIQKHSRASPKHWRVEDQSVHSPRYWCVSGAADLVSAPLPSTRLQDSEEHPKSSSPGTAPIQSCNAKVVHVVQFTINPGRGAAPQHRVYFEHRNPLVLPHGSRFFFWVFFMVVFGYFLWFSGLRLQKTCKNHKDRPNLGFFGVFFMVFWASMYGTCTRRKDGP